MGNRIIRHPVRFFWHGIILPVLCWITIVPLTLLIPRKKNLLIFYGRDRGRFGDNVKYLYLHAHIKGNTNVKYFFLSEHADVINLLRQNKMPVLPYPSLKAAWKLLRAGVIVTDSDGWISKSRYHLLYTAFKVQLWHGVGLKTIGLDNPRVKRLREHPLMRAHFALKGRLVPYDILVTTSTAFAECGYPSGLRKKKIVTTGYPRNDVLFHAYNGLEWIGVDKAAAERLQTFRKQGGKTAAYVPTFRDSRKDAISTGALDIDRLDHFCREQNLLMVFKFHSWGMLRDNAILHALERAHNVVLYDNHCDIYPVLKDIDFMVSDLSSIYMDFLLLDRPVLFFTCFIEEYLCEERNFYYKYDELTPGHKCSDQEQLEAALKTCLNGKDEFAGERRKLRQKTFTHCDGRAAERIWKIIMDRAIQRQE